MDNKIKIHCDGGARGNPGAAACAFVVIEKDNVIFEDSSFLGVTTNNVAEYEGVILAMKWLIENNYYSVVEFYLDSQLVVKQINGDYKVKNERLKELYMDTKSLEKYINAKIKYIDIPRSSNTLPDKLLNKTIDENL